jgi:hypothetical protein
VQGAARKRRGIVFVVLFFGLLWFVFELLVTRVPPQSQTRGTMYELQDRIVEFDWNHSRPPESLEEALRDVYWKEDLLRNEWGHLIQYRVTDGHVVLTSLGRDGKIGGTGRNEDIVIEFDLTQQN